VPVLTEQDLSARAMNPEPILAEKNLSARAMNAEPLLLEKDLSARATANQKPKATAYKKSFGRQRFKILNR
jgi:hypothetical protein